MTLLSPLPATLLPSDLRAAQEVLDEALAQAEAEQAALELLLEREAERLWCAEV